MSKSSKRMRLLRYGEANGTPCVYCKRIMDARSPLLMPTRDHTTPISLGGRHTVFCCYQCNEIKADMLWESWLSFMSAYPGWWKGIPSFIRNRYRPGNLSDKIRWKTPVANAPERA